MNPEDAVIELTAPPITAEIVDVTPDDARTWLLKNSINRALREQRVLQYARAMLDGKWQVTNDDLCFDSDGNLLNGQHRLNAVVLSGRTVRMSVKRNVPRESMHLMDRGAARLLSDTLRLQGESDTHALAAGIRQVWLWETGNFYRQNSVSANDDELLAVLEEHPEIRRSVRAARSARLDCTLTAVSMAHWLIQRVNGSEVADMFIDQLRTRANEPTDSPVHALANRFMNLRRAGAKPRVEEYVYMIIKAWNLWASGKRAHRIAASPKEGQEFRIPPVVRWENSAG